MSFLTINILFCVISLGNTMSYTPFGDEFEIRLSDHQMFARDVCLEGEAITLVTYNSWARGTRNGFMGFQGYETLGMEPNVEERTNKNVERIAQLIHEKPNPVIALQEWNEKDLKKLRQRIGREMILITRPVAGESFKNAILVRRDKFIVKDVSTLGLGLDELMWTTPNDQAGSQKKRYLHVVLESRGTKERLDVVNVHLKWLSDDADIGDTVSELIGEFDNVVVMGDFNQDLSGIAPDGATVSVAVDGSLAVEAKERNPYRKTNDAIIYKFN